ncbi:pyridine nucleotide transhydrogenase, alpha subunit [Legionella birminghamensis]|uniref:NAD(P) transhydrogenase subunit alpha part 1 n=1 Tax=Legionella birminghamensis TaxID=28083 RepID=A0A378IAG0_9GAMM|nr:Re/Si-specific NAD(P)(+) transhydrogenase subunit alpha [Legionella birminghamensis]KTC76149.1 pyridine nucleotide transhydrogenase, alpha subunit [Legionella birminghamensis]STX32227.1 NAD(P) transhydrogenase subunit alpha [Legionella birminghamensis]
MIITALNENSHDTRVAITPSVVKHYNKLELQVCCETNAGAAAGFSDDDYVQAGAKIIANRQELLGQTNILVCVSELAPSELDGLQSNSLIVGPFDNQIDSEIVSWATARQMSLFSMNLIPRISRAQSMDSLSSQANLAGYRAILEAVQYYHRAIPMMMTAAGMIHPAKVLILGAGVAGLQAIATAKRLGAVVYAFDVRRAAKEQVESLGAEFIEVSEEADAETSGGYAREMSEEYKALQAELIDKYAQMADIIVCTALIPGRKAPVLIKSATVAHMKEGSVIVDLATSRGGNCEGSQKDQIIKINEVSIIGISNMAGLVPATASELYANNVLNLIRLMAETPGSLSFNKEDEIMKQALLCHQGAYMPFQSVKEAQNA